MIEAEKSITIDTDIETVWDHVRDIRNWANLFPGCRECMVIDHNHSRWVIKVGAGGMVRTVHVLVHVEQWDGPERVNFSYKLEGDPAQGSGSYIATRKAPGETEITLKVCVEGSGPTASMWETMSKPLLPQLAKTFGGRLKDKIENTVDGRKPLEAGIPRDSVFGALWGKLRHLWRRIFPSKNR